MELHTAVILAGGLGTRLGDLTKNMPKPLLNVAGKPFLCRVIDHCLKEKIDTFILAVGYLYEKFSGFFKEYYPGLKVKFSIEKEPLGTGGALKKSLEFLPDDLDFFLLNGDTYFDISYEALAVFHQHKKASVTVALKDMDNLDRFGTVLVDESGLVKAFLEKQQGQRGLINSGVYIVNKKMMGTCSIDGVFSLEKEILYNLVQDRKIYALSFDGLFIDIGVPNDYELAQKMFSKNNLTP